MTRRSLIRRALGVLGIAPLANACAPRRINASSGNGAETTERSRLPGEVLQDEFDDLVAFGEALVSARPLDHEARAHLVAHIRERTSTVPAHRESYRRAATIVNDLAGRRFAALPLAQRIELIAHHGLARRRAAAASPDVDHLRSDVAPDLIRGYYASAAGWRLVGYTAYPGICGELTTYTRRGA